MKREKLTVEELEKLSPEELERLLDKLNFEEREELLEKFRRRDKFKEDKEYVLKTSREEMKEDFKGIDSVTLINNRRYWEEFLALHPETKTAQPEFYNKILIFCDVMEELEIRHRRESFGGLLTTGAGTGFKIAEVVTMILLAILGIAFVVKLVRVGLVDAIGYLILFAIGYFFYYFLGKDWKFKKRGEK